MSRPSSVTEPSSHLIIGMAHDRVAQRALTRTVGTHECMNFSLADRQVHAPQDFLASDGHAQVFDAKFLGHQSFILFRSTSSLNHTLWQSAAECLDVIRPSLF